MRSRLSMSLVVILGGLCMMAPVALAVGRTSGQEPHARIVAVEGASTTFHVAGMHGQRVTVQVRSRSLAAVHLSNTAQGTVEATVVAVNSATHRVTVHTHEGQTLVLDMAPPVLRELRRGEPMMLVASRQPA